ncbi:hypothetical protein D3C78_97330 [compost metagenome]
MSESPVQQLKKKKQEEEIAFNDLRDKLIEKLTGLLNHNVLDKIRERNLLKFKEIDNISQIFRRQITLLEKEFTTVLSKWVLDIISSKIYNIESIFNHLMNALNENKKNPEIQHIGSENKRTFSEYSELLMITVIQLDHDVDYLQSLYDELATQKQNLILVGNNQFLEKVEQARNELNKEVQDFRTKRNIADNALTVDFYDKAVKKYEEKEKAYRNLFYLFIALTLGISVLLFVLHTDLTDISFWVMKITVILVGITLITYFLKQSAHYQRLADQNYQTKVELLAFPSFMESIPTEEAASVRKELALKYFGREIDGAAHKDMSNLISDQMKSTTEMVKAATDVLKAKG